VVARRAQLKKLRAVTPGTSEEIAAASTAATGKNVLDAEVSGH
jgi:hypothetical protein